MANEPISQLTQTTAPSAFDCVPIVSQGITQKVSINTIVNSASNNIMGDPFFYASGQWLSTKGAVASATVVNNQVTVYPWILGQSVSINAVSTDLTSGAIPSGVIYMGIYSATATGNMPGTLISASTATMSGSAGGFSTYTYSTPVTLTPGVYWLAAGFSGGSPNFSQNNLCSMYSLPSNSPITTNITGYSMTFSGSLPSTFVISGFNLNTIKVWLKLV
jgi:hypothetical protein